MSANDRLAPRGNGLRGSRGLLGCGAAGLILIAGSVCPAQDADAEKASETPRTTGTPGGTTSTVRPGAPGAQPTKPDDGKTGAARGATGASGDGRTRAVPGAVQTPPGAGGVVPLGQPGAQPGGARPGGQVGGVHGGPVTAQAAGDDDYILGESSEPIDLRALVEWVAGELQINVSATEELTGSVILNAPVVVRKAELLPLLDSLLEQQQPGFTIVQDRPGFYRIIKSSDVGVGFVGGTTRIIPTPTIRPSSLQDMVNAQLGTQNRTIRINYMDDLGVIVVTDSPRRVELLEQLVQRVLARSQEQEFLRFELTHIAASAARSRVLDLLGAQQPNALQIMQQGGMPTISAGGAVTSLAERLTVDPQGNALILRGFPDEAARVEQVLRVIDRPVVLQYQQYYAGPAALDVAKHAERQGLGSVETIDLTGQETQPRTGSQGNAQAQQNIFQQGLLGQTQQQVSAGGPVMLVDPYRGTITYYGTPAQHSELAQLIRVFDAERDLLVIEGYKVKNVQADLVAEIVQSLITGEPMTDTASGFLPGGRERASARRTSGGGSGRGMSGSSDPFGQLGQSQQGGTRGGAGRQSRQGGVSSFGNDQIFVVADRSNNQILVKAPQRQQPDFAKLIDRLDQRRAQVYIEVQIVSVSDTNDFRLAVETQLINAGGTGGAINTNFGLGTLTTTSGTGNDQTTTGGFTSPKNVATGLAGITAAIIKSDQVPIVINAIQRVTDARILSSPQLLVDDNEIAEIVSLEEQPTTTQSQGTSTTITSFQDYQSAGTSLSVQPSISEAGYMRLWYDIELSNFIGTGSNGVPPPRQTRNVTSDSVTIPDGTTIIVGGITVNARNRTIAKVPLLGDIPLLGLLFRDTNKSAVNTRLYVFITPRILRDPHFRDLILLTKGPQAESGIGSDMPELRPALIEMAPSPRRTHEPQGLPEPPSRRDEVPQLQPVPSSILKPEGQ